MPSAMATIGCETCHGGARRWLTQHYQRDVGREELVSLGMIDTKNVLVRARVCAACHVGSAENDMNHDMIAAGHPPLHFEMASYEALINCKHWDDQPRRTENPDYEFQLWAAGRIAAAEAALALLESRAKHSEARAHNAEPSWPEFAELNCAACHHSLTGFGDHRGTPLSWRRWNVSLVNALPLASEHQRKQFARLEGLFAAKLVPDQEAIAKEAGQARAAIIGQVHVSAEGLLLGDERRPLTISNVIQGSSDTMRTSTWDDRCQQVAMLASVRRSLIDRGVDPTSLPDERLARVAAELRRAEHGSTRSAAGGDRWKSVDDELRRCARALLDVEARTRPVTPPEVLP